MKCINKIIAVTVSVCLSFTLTGCGQTEAPLASRYDVYQNVYRVSSNYDSEGTFFAEQLCVGGITNSGMEAVDSQVAEGAGVFRLADGKISYAQNLYEKLYPASTTKILTAYLAIKYGDLNDIVTVSEKAATQASDSSVCGLIAGDQMSLRDLLYGLMMRSGNDAAVAIAEHISGDVDSFATLMNEEATAMGATTSHFVNPHGLPDEEHYTSVYDLYLIFQTAVKVDTFREIIQTKNHTANYTHGDGTPATSDWISTNQYFAGEATAPEGFSVIGGKTGTTGEAGYCLVLLSQNDNGDELISIVLKGDCKSNLYLLMNQILKGYGN